MERGDYLVAILAVWVSGCIFGDSEPTIELGQLKDDPALCGQYVGEVRDRVLGFRAALAVGCVGKQQPELLQGFCEFQPTLGALSGVLEGIPDDACDRYRNVLTAADLTTRSYAAWKRALPELAK